MDVSEGKLEKMIKEIAQCLDCGLDVFLYKDFSKIIEIPNEMSYTLGDLDELYEDDLREINDNIQNLIKLEPPDSRDGFLIMESFTYNLTDDKLKYRLIETLNNRKPFSNFNRIVQNSKLREDWYKHKTLELEKRVRLFIEIEILSWINNTI